MNEKNALNFHMCHTYTQFWIFIKHLEMRAVYTHTHARVCMKKRKLLKSMTENDDSKTQ